MSFYTIGYSGFEATAFIATLKHHGITAIADVRSHPYSKYRAEYNGDFLQVLLESHNIAYVFLGDCLGARPQDPQCYRNGRAEYPLIAQSPAFQVGLGRLHKGAGRYSIALMCSEPDPIDCHRAILVGRHLSFPVHHITKSGVEQQQDFEARLVALEGSPLIGTTIADAYDSRGRKICYQQRF